MSLSKAIIDGNIQTVQALLQKGAPVNILDEYGYTPLIHATATNRLDLVNLILKNRAEPDLLDAGGQTALHWAVNNNNVTITEALLLHGANPNAYTGNGQPILFYPLLRQHRQLIQLLCHKGANLDYAKDFIHAKLLGHRFELKGKTDIINDAGYFMPIDLEGFYLEFTLKILMESLSRYINSFEARQHDIHESELRRIIEAFQNAIDLRNFKHFSVDVEESKSKIVPLFHTDLLLLPVSYRSHAITFIRHGDFFAKCDRGVEKMTAPITIHRLGNAKALTDDYMVNLLYKRQTDTTIKRELVRRLQLVPYAELPIKHQITGNCSWANAESSVPTMLYMLLHDKISSKSALPLLLKEIMDFYLRWLDWDKDRAIEDWLVDFEKASFARQKTKAALLGAILFQATNLNKPRDMARAKKIMTILTRKEFHYIIAAYARAYVQSHRTPEGIAFSRVVEALGYRLSQFR